MHRLHFDILLFMTIFFSVLSRREAGWDLTTQINRTSGRTWPNALLFLEALPRLSSFCCNFSCHTRGCCEHKTQFFIDINQCGKRSISKIWKQLQTCPWTILPSGKSSPVELSLELDGPHHIFSNQKKTQPIWTLLEDLMHLILKRNRR